jgi:hypothetical protein
MLVLAVECMVLLAMPIEAVVTVVTLYILIACGTVNATTKKPKYDIQTARVPTFRLSELCIFAQCVAVLVVNLCNATHIAIRYALQVTMSFHAFLNSNLISLSIFCGVVMGVYVPLASPSIAPDPTAPLLPELTAGGVYSTSFVPTSARIISDVADIGDGVCVDWYAKADGGGVTFSQLTDLRRIGIVVAVRTGAGAGLVNPLYMLRPTIDVAASVATAAATAVVTVEGAGEATSGER